MYSGVVNKTTPIIDLITVLTGIWDEREEQGWKIIMCPFFTVMTRVCDPGSVPLPFKVTIPTPAMLFGKDGEAIKAIIVKPGQDALDVPEAGVVQMQIFGAASQLRAVR